MEDVGFYTESVRELILQDSKTEFDELLKKKKEGYKNEFNAIIPKWEENFSNYFDKNIMIDIEAIAKYAISPLVGECFNNFTGVNTVRSSCV